MARQLTFFAARRKDAGRRCDLEAGMAKLLSARVAWSAADNAVQIQGGNGFALESPVSSGCCAMPAFCRSSRAPPKFRPRSLRAGCGTAATELNPAALNLVPPI